MNYLNSNTEWSIYLGGTFKTSAYNIMKIFLYKTQLAIPKKNEFEITDNIECADFIFLVFKIKSKLTKIKFVHEDTIPIISEALELSKKYNKKLVYYCGGDRPPRTLPDYPNVIVLNTSVSVSTMPKNEMVIGVPVDDKFKNYIENPTLSIGFCGQRMCGRQKWLDYLTNISEIETNFIIRDSYIHNLKSNQINDFETNMNDNLFIFCYRGAGNYSVRFYETIMRGRIPIVIKTDNVFPFEDIIDYNKVGIFIEENEINDTNTLKDVILNYYNSKTADELICVQNYNREIYLNFFHPDIFWGKIFTYIHK